MGVARMRVTPRRGDARGDRGWLIRVRVTGVHLALRRGDARGDRRRGVGVGVTPVRRARHRTGDDHEPGHRGSPSLLAHAGQEP